MSGECGVFGRSVGLSLPVGRDVGIWGSNRFFLGYIFCFEVWGWISVRKLGLAGKGLEVLIWRYGEVARALGGFFCSTLVFHFLVSVPIFLFPFFQNDRTGGVDALCFYSFLNARWISPSHFWKKGVSIWSGPWSGPYSDTLLLEKITLNNCIVPLFHTCTCCSREIYSDWEQFVLVITPIWNTHA